MSGTPSRTEEPLAVATFEEEIPAAAAEDAALEAEPEEALAGMRPPKRAARWRVPQAGVAGVRSRNTAVACDASRRNTAQVREQGGRYMHRLPRRMRRKMRGGGADRIEMRSRSGAMMSAAEPGAEPSAIRPSRPAGSHRAQ